MIQNKCAFAILNLDSTISKYLQDTNKYCFDRSMNVIEKKLLKNRGGRPGADSKIIDLLAKKIHEIKESIDAQSIDKQKWEEISQHIQTFAEKSTDTQVPAITPSLLTDIQEITDGFNKQKLVPLPKEKSKETASPAKLATFLASVQRTLQQTVLAQAARLLKHTFMEEFEKLGGKTKRYICDQITIDWEAIKDLNAEETAISMTVASAHSKSTSSDYHNALKDLIQKRHQLSEQSSDRIIKIWLLYSAFCCMDGVAHNNQTLADEEFSIKKLLQEKELCKQYALELETLKTAQQTLDGEKKKILKEKGMCDFNSVYGGSLKEFQAKKYDALVTACSWFNVKELYPVYHKQYSLYQKNANNNTQPLRSLDQVYKLLPTPEEFSDYLIPSLSSKELIERLLKDMPLLLEEHVIKTSDSESYNYLRNYFHDLVFNKDVHLSPTQSKQPLQHAHTAIEEKLPEKLQTLTIVEKTPDNDMPSPLPEKELDNWTTVTKKTKKPLPSTPNDFFSKATLAPRVKDWFQGIPQTLTKDKYRNMSPKLQEKMRLFHSYPGIITFYALQHGMLRKWHSETTAQNNKHFSLVGMIEEYGKPGTPCYKGLFNDCIDTRNGTFEIYHHCFAEKPFDTIMEEYAHKGFLALDKLRQKKETLKESPQPSAQFTDNKRFTITHYDYVTIIDDTQNKIKYTLCCSLG